MGLEEPPAAAPRKRGRPPAASITAGAAGDSMCLFLLCARRSSLARPQPRARAQLTWSPEQLTLQLPLWGGVSGPLPLPLLMSVPCSALRSAPSFSSSPPGNLAQGRDAGFPGAQGGVGLGLPSPGGHSPAVRTACPRIALFPVHVRDTHPFPICPSGFSGGPAPGGQSRAGTALLRPKMTKTRLEPSLALPGCLLKTQLQHLYFPFSNYSPSRLRTKQIKSSRLPRRQTKIWTQIY